MYINQYLSRNLVSLRRLFQKNSGLLISYPKSGRTWLRLMLDHLHCHVKASHSGSNISKGLDFSDIPSPDFDNSLPVLFLFRNPIDVVVSSWFQYCHRIDSGLVIPLKEFVRHPSYGVEKIVKFNLMYLENSSFNNVKFASINYEVLVSQPALCLEQVFRFYRPDAMISRDNVIKAVKKYSFNSMKIIERKQLILQGDSFFGAVPGNPAEPESFKVRKGLVCGYRAYLDDDDIQYCDRVMSSHDYAFRLQNIHCHLLPLDPLLNSFSK